MQSSSKRHKVLLLGSGLMTPALVDYLVSFKDTHITVGSNIIKDAEAVTARHPQFMSAVYIDIFNAKDLDQLVAQHDAVISFVPPTMHMPICESCLRLGKNLTTSSYISPDMEKIHEAVKAKGLIFLNECGLDPGIDIMSTMKVKDEAEEMGFKVVSYESYCGGLPVAEQADNPLGYKFSWNPGAGIKASKNKAIYKKNGKIVEAQAPLKVVEQRNDISVAMKLEVYPNRDSISFMEKFGMQDCETFVRGTIRFSGFSHVISAFHDIGLTSDDPVPDGVQTLRDLAESKFRGTKLANLDHYYPEAKVAIKTLCNELEEEGTKNPNYCLLRQFCNVDISHIPQNEREDFFKQLIKTLRFLGFFDGEKVVTRTKDGKPRSYLEAFSDVLANKLSMTDDDRDLVVMRHNFILEDPKTKKRWNHYSTLIASGSSKKQGGYTIMAKTVGVTAAIGMRMILDGRIKERGVLSPIKKEVYNPCLQELERHGIVLIEESERFHTMMRPKL